MEDGTKRFLFDAMSALILLFTALLGAWCPKYLTQRSGHQVVEGRSLLFSLGNMLSGGVMLSAGFCHLLADSLAIVVFVGRFPLTPFLAAVGYIVTLCADQVVQHFSEEKPAVMKSGGSDVGLVSLPSSKSARSSTPKQVHRHHRETIELPILDDTVPLRSSSNTIVHMNSGYSDQWHEHNHMQVLLSQKPLAFATSVLLAAALCVHSILEGMALGSQGTLKDAQDIMIAIVAHKGLAAYALGSSVIDSKVSSSKFWTVIGLFSMATPVGIFLGYGLAEVSSSAGAASLSALASGTFLYVAVMEVIPKELATSDHRLMKMSMLLLGFGLMSMLAIWA